jgi:tetratricopeptide (TPR) repeat protein
LWQVAAVVSCALGAGAKEILVAAPLLALVYDRLFVSGSFSRSLRARAGLYAGLFASLALIPLNLYMAEFHRTALVGQDTLSSWDYLKTQSQVLVLYLRLGLWPDPLIIDYQDWPTHPTLASVLPSAALILALLAATAWGVSRAWPAAYAGAWLFLILAPTSSILPLPTEVATERRMYLPLMAIMALVVLGAYRLGSRLRLGPRAPVYGTGALAGVVVLAGVQRTLWRNEDYKDPVALWADVIVRRPNNNRAYNNLAFELLARGETAAAKDCFLQSVRVRPDDHVAWNNLGIIYMGEGNEAETVRCLDTAIGLRPDYAAAYRNRAIVHRSKGQLAEAEGCLREAIRLEPGRPGHHIRLAKVLVERGRFAEAEQASRAAIEFDPQSAAAYHQLGKTLAAAGRDAESRDAFRAADARQGSAGDSADR